MKRFASIALAALLVAGCSGDAPAEPEAEIRPEFVLLPRGEREEVFLPELESEVPPNSNVSVCQPRREHVFTAIPGSLQIPAPPTLREEPAPVQATPAECGIEWLARHQSPDGSWSAAGFSACCKGEPCGGGGTAMGDAGATGVAILPFLGSGYTHKAPRYGNVVRNGLKCLKSIQDDDGAFGPRDGPLRDHALAALAMVEAYGMTQSPLFKEPARRGVEFLLRCRRSGGAWGRTEKAEADDLSVSIWCLMACKSAVLSELEVDPAVFREFAAWLDREFDPTHLAPTATASTSSDALLAMASIGRVFCGAEKGDPKALAVRELCERRGPSWREPPETNDLEYWYFGTLAMFATSTGYRPWPSNDPQCMAWADGLKNAIGPHLGGADAGCARGSMVPGDPATREGGRVYATALAAMTWEVFYR